MKSVFFISLTLLLCTNKHYNANKHLIITHNIGFMALTGKNSCFTTKNGRNKLAGGIMAGFITAGINMAVFVKNRQIKPAILIPCKVSQIIDNMC